MNGLKFVKNDWQDHCKLCYHKVSILNKIKKKINKSTLFNEGNTNSLQLMNP